MAYISRQNMPRGAILSTIPMITDDVIVPGSDEEDSPVSKAERQRRREEIGRAYLRGHVPFIQSAQLKGPFDHASGWRNPWRHVPRKSTHHVSSKPIDHDIDETEYLSDPPVADETMSDDLQLLAAAANNELPIFGEEERLNLSRRGMQNTSTVPFDVETTPKFGEEAEDDDILQASQEDVDRFIRLSARKLESLIRQPILQPVSQPVTQGTKRKLRPKWLKGAPAMKRSRSEPQWQSSPTPAHGVGRTFGSNLGERSTKPAKSQLITASSTSPPQSHGPRWGNVGVLKGPMEPHKTYGSSTGTTDQKIQAVASFHKKESPIHNSYVETESKPGHIELDLYQNNPDSNDSRRKNYALYEDEQEAQISRGRSRSPDGTDLGPQTLDLYSTIIAVDRNESRRPLKFIESDELEAEGSLEVTSGEPCPQRQLGTRTKTSKPLLHNTPRHFDPPSSSPGSFQYRKIRRGPTLRSNLKSTHPGESTEFSHNKLIPDAAQPDLEPVHSNPFTIAEDGRFPDVNACSSNGLYQRNSEPNCSDIGESRFTLDGTTRGPALDLLGETTMEDSEPLPSFVKVCRTQIEPTSEYSEELSQHKQDFFGNGDYYDDNVTISLGGETYYNATQSPEFVTLQNLLLSNVTDDGTGNASYSDEVERVRNSVNRGESHDESRISALPYSDHASQANTSDITVENPCQLNAVENKDEEPLVQSPWVTNDLKYAPGTFHFGGDTDPDMLASQEDVIKNASTDKDQQKIKTNEEFIPELVVPTAEQNARTPEHDTTNPFQDLMTPSSQRRNSRKSATHLSESKHVRDGILANPWCSAFKKPESGTKKKRVSFIDLLSGSETNDSEKEPCKPVRELESPPPPPGTKRLTHLDDKFHWRLKGTKDLMCTEESGTRFCAAPSSITDLPPSSPAVAAMAEAFIAADRETSYEENSNFATNEDETVIYDYVSRKYWTTEEMARGLHRAWKVDTVNQPEKSHSQDTSQEKEKPSFTMTPVEIESHFENVTLDFNEEENIAAVVEDMGSFLEGWDIETELKKTHETSQLSRGVYPGWGQRGHLSGILNR